MEILIFRAHNADHAVVSMIIGIILMAEIGFNFKFSLKLEICPMIAGLLMNFRSKTIVPDDFNSGISLEIHQLCSLNGIATRFKNELHAVADIRTN